VQWYRLALLLHEQTDVKNDKASKKTGLSARQIKWWQSCLAAGDFSVEG
jgi:hypothetical protein